MKSTLTLALLLILSGCKKNPPAPAPAAVDAGAPAALQAIVERPPPVPMIDDDLQLVAIGKTPTSTLLWLQEHGSRVWLSGNNLDAFADGDGPLAKAYDPLQKLPYKAGFHSLQIVGHYPHLFALRMKAAPERAESPAPTVFVYRAADKGPGAWKEAGKLPYAFWPHAFIPFRDGVVFVSGKHDQFDNAIYHSGDGPGTKVSFVAADGKVSDLDIAIDERFMAYAGSSTPDTLTLIGSTANASDHAEGPHVLRLGRDGTTRRYEVQKHAPANNVVPKAEAVHEHSGRAIVVAPHMAREDHTIWAPDAMTAYVLDAAGKSTPVTLPGGPGCFLLDAQHVGDSVYAIRTCGKERASTLVRTEKGGKQARIAMPAIVDAGASDCGPTKLVVRDPDDLWVVAECRQLVDEALVLTRTFVLRRGHGQKPIELP